MSDIVSGLQRMIGELKQSLEVQHRRDARYCKILQKIIQNIQEHDSALIKLEKHIKSIETEFAEYKKPLHEKICGFSLPCYSVARVDENELAVSQINQQKAAEAYSSVSFIEGNTELQMDRQRYSKKVRL